jgi:thiosulfate/3-mercaptopyruvate sulfurtransferase
MPTVKLLSLQRYLCYLLLLSAFACNATTNSEDELVLVDIPWLAEHKADPNLIIVDARSEKDYEKEHISGAINIPVTQTFNPQHHKDRVGNFQYIQHLFRNAGVQPEDTVIIYDDSSYIDAARVFWVFEVYGHKHVKLLNGGFPAWRKNAALAVSSTATVLPPSEIIPAIDPQRLATRFSMRLAIDDADKVIIDSRSAEEYNGIRSIASRSGHIPGAINIPWQQNFVEVDGINMLKSNDEIRKTYDRLVQDKKVYAYCNKGKQSSLTYTILRQLGHDVAHYDGSWYEWGNDATLPIEHPEAKSP